MIIVLNKAGDNQSLWRIEYLVPLQRDTQQNWILLRVGSLRFNNPHSGDSNTHQQVGTQERSEDINFNNPSNGFSECEGRSRSEDLLVVVVSYYSK